MAAISPISYKTAIPGGLSAATARASRSKRATLSWSTANSVGNTLSATRRPRRESSARYTTPIPPAPSFESIWYWAICWPIILSDPLSRHGRSRPAASQFATRHMCRYSAHSKLFASLVAALSVEMSVVKIGRAFVLLDGIAAVDDNHLAGDVGCGFGSEERDRSGDFVRTAGSADRGILTGNDFLRG